MLEKRHEHLHNDRFKKKKKLFHLKTRQTVLIENQSLHLLPVIGRHKKKVP